MTSRNSRRSKKSAAIQRDNHFSNLLYLADTSHVFVDMRADYLIQPEVDKSFVQTTKYTLHAR